MHDFHGANVIRERGGEVTLGQQQRSFAPASSRSQDNLAALKLQGFRATRLCRSHCYRRQKTLGLTAEVGNKLCVAGAS